MHIDLHYATFCGVRGAGPDEARTTSVGCNKTCRDCSRLLWMRSSSMSTAMTPMRCLGCTTVVRAGLDGGERVVVDGQSRLVNGSKVEVKESVEAAAAAAAATVLKPRL